MRAPLKTPETDKTPDKTRDVPWEEIEQAIQGIRFGTVQLIIQDGRVIQIDKTEKIRLISP